MRAVLLSGEDVANVEETKDLDCFVSNDGRGDKVTLRITDLTEGKYPQWAFLDDLVCDP